MSACDSSKVKLKGKLKEQPTINPCASQILDCTVDAARVLLRIHPCLSSFWGPGAGGWGGFHQYSCISNQELMEDMARQGKARHGMANVNSEQAQCRCRCQCPCWFGVI